MTIPRTNQLPARAPALDLRAWLRWAPTFLGFPLAGLAGRAVAGNVDDVSAAVTGGLVAGVVLGAVQALGLGQRAASKPGWIVGTGVGMAAGLGLGAAAVDFATDPGALVAMGAISGLAVGLGQAAAMRAPLARRVGWVGATGALWALGWWITSMVIVDADRQHTNFGASGAVVVTLLGGLLLAWQPAAAERRDGSGSADG